MPIDLEKLRAAVERMTPGEWRDDGNGCYIFGRSVGGSSMAMSDFPVAQIRGWGHLQYLGEDKAKAIQCANAAGIVALRNAASALIAELAAAREVVEAASGENEDALDAALLRYRLAVAGKEDG